jgi:hypothetical protein
MNAWRPALTRTRILKTRVVVAPAPLLYLADVAPDAPPGMTLMAEARHFFA